MTYTPGILSPDFSWYVKCLSLRRREQNHPLRSSNLDAPVPLLRVCFSQAWCRDIRLKYYGLGFSGGDHPADPSSLTSPRESTRHKPLCMNQTFETPSTVSWEELVCSGYNSHDPFQELALWYVNPTLEASILSSDYTGSLREAGLTCTFTGVRSASSLIYRSKSTWRFTALPAPSLFKLYLPQVCSIIIEEKECAKFSHAIKTLCIQRNFTME